MNPSIRNLITEAKEWLNNSNPVIIHNYVAETSNLIQKLIVALQEQEKIARHASQERDLYDARITGLEIENKELLNNIKNNSIRLP